MRDNFNTQKKVKEIFLCNLLEEGGQLFYSTKNDIATLKKLGFKGKAFDSKITISYRDGLPSCMKLIKLPEQEVICQVMGTPLSHFLGLPSFNYETIATHKKSLESESDLLKKRLVVNIYKYVVSKSA